MRSFESYRGFTIAAWVLILLFSAFTYHLIMIFNQKAEQLSQDQTAHVFDNTHDTTTPPAH
jgi:hypothetical protein